jgi:hypothetical protein
MRATQGRQKETVPVAMLTLDRLIASRPTEVPRRVGH